VVPAAEAASMFADKPSPPYGLNRAGPIEQAQANTAPEPSPPATAQQMQASLPLTHDDIVKVQEKLESLGFKPGAADGRPGKQTLQALNAYRKSLGLQPTQVVDRQAVAPLTP
jgi:peptidoglycan hydrolase-like protein with peptidoglycan-binding domain